MAEMTFDQLQARLLKVARDVYGYDPFPRFHLLHKAHRGEAWLLCGLKGLANSNKCDGYECVESSVSPAPICWRFYRFQDHQFWAPCSWLRLDDAFNELLRREKMQPCSGYEMFRVAPRSLNTRESIDQKSLWDVVETDRVDETEASPAPRVDIMVSRIVRDTTAAKALKDLYGGQCQVCGIVLHAGETIYSEVHHLRPLGVPHDGPDDWNNMMVLCPNHHALFDYGVPLWRNESTLEINGTMFVLQMRHEIDVKNIDYYKQYVQMQTK